MSPNLINLCVIIGHRNRKLSIVRLIVAGWTHIQIFFRTFATGQLTIVRKSDSSGKKLCTSRDLQAIKSCFSPKLVVFLKHIIIIMIKTHLLKTRNHKTIGITTVLVVVVIVNIVNERSIHAVMNVILNTHADTRSAASEEWQRPMYFDCENRLSMNRFSSHGD